MKGDALNEEHLDKTKAMSGGDLSLLSDRTRKLAEHGQASLLIYHRGGVQIVPLAEARPVVVGRRHPSTIAIRNTSLSRQHARIELVNGQVWVEDLQSTNGTWVDQRRIDRAAVEPGMELRLGALSASVQLLGPMESRQFGLFSHDHFQLDLEAEVIRARTFGRTLALLMLQARGRGDGGASRWFSLVQDSLRPFDRIALYCSDTAEILLPEADESLATSFARRLLALEPNLVCGIATLPAQASSPGELVQVALSALRETDRGRPVRTAETQVRTTTPVEEESAGTGPVIQSGAMKRLFQTVRRLSTSVIPVLLLGDTGTGKEVVAHALHEDGPRRSHSMICVNCGGIPSQLMESTLFGHEKGAFTGASGRSKGVFESANGGTVFLDEVGELPASAQAALLRVLESKRFSRVGSNREIEVDVRIVAATHRDLEAMAADGSFREDLLYRLNAMTLTIPPLRERPDDIGPLAHRFVQQANQANGCAIRAVGDEAIEALRTYAWPGNVRELRNAIERAVVIAMDDTITLDDLPERVVAGRSRVGTDTSITTPGGAAQTGGSVPSGEYSLKQELGRIEKELITVALEQANWDRRAAAERLSLPLRTLAHKIQVLDVRKP